MLKIPDLLIACRTARTRSVVNPQRPRVCPLGSGTAYFERAVAALRSVPACAQGPLAMATSNSSGKHPFPL